MKKLFAAAMIMILWTVSPALGSEWKVDTDHAMIGFEIKHIYATVSGQFKEFEGTMIFNPDHLEDARFDFSVATNSIDTGIEKRDNHLRSDDFFSTDRYPYMTFKTTKVTLVSSNTYRVEGNLSIKDVTKPIKITVDYLGQKDHPFDKKKRVAGFETRFSIDRLAFNVGSGKFYDMGVVGKDVDVIISLEALADN